MPDHPIGAVQPWTDDQRRSVDLRTEHAADTGRLHDALRDGGWTVERSEMVMRVATDASRAADLNRAATALGLTLSSLVVVQDSLEDIFLAMTGPVDAGATPLWEAA